jgi:hypothetical protein
LKRRGDRSCVEKEEIELNLFAAPPPEILSAFFGEEEGN